MQLPLPPPLPPVPLWYDYDYDYDYDDDDDDDDDYHYYHYYYYCYHHHHHHHYYYYYYYYYYYWVQYTTIIITSSLITAKRAPVLKAPSAGSEIIQISDSRNCPPTHPNKNKQNVDVVKEINSIWNPGHQYKFLGCWLLFQTQYFVAPFALPKATRNASFCTNLYRYAGHHEFHWWEP